MKKHPLIDTLVSLKGNPRACMYTEPLWTIPWNLYMPFVSVYMAALYLTDSQIGLVASVTMLFMAVSAILSGAITDKLGRRRTTFIFDILSWSVPCLLWAFSQNFWWFMVAAAFNGLMQVTANSWVCLLVEDAQKSTLVRIFSLLHVIGQLSVIFAPIAAILVNRYTVVPVVRVLYFYSFVSMTIKFIILYKYSTETEVGKTRMSETTGMSIFDIMSGYGTIIKRIFASFDMKLALALNTIFYIIATVSANFFGLYITGPMLMPDYVLAYYPIVRSVVIIVFMFFVQAHMGKFKFKRPMQAGVLLYLCGYAILLLSAPGNYIIPFVYILIEACAFSLVIPSKDSLVVILIDADERARISSIMTSLVLFISMPFGYLAGWLSDMNRRWPFLLIIALFVIVFIILCAGGKHMEKHAPDEPEGELAGAGDE